MIFDGRQRLPSSMTSISESFMVINMHQYPLITTSLNPIMMIIIQPLTIPKTAIHHHSISPHQK